MKRRNDLYNLGNDYNQEVSAYFLDTDDKVKDKEFYGKAYSDGLYHYTQKPAYELSGGKDALNKRILNVLPQSAWTPNETLEASAFSAAPDASAVFSPDYATAIADDTVDGPFKK
jgi:hypothetical protein